MCWDGSPTRYAQEAPPFLRLCSVKHFVFGTLAWVSQVFIQPCSCSAVKIFPWTLNKGSSVLWCPDLARLIHKMGQKLGFAGTGNIGNCKTFSQNWMVFDHDIEMTTRFFPNCKSTSHKPWNVHTCFWDSGTKFECLRSRKNPRSNVVYARTSTCEV